MAVLVAAAAVELVDYTFGLACRIFPEISPIIKFFWLNSLIAFILRQRTFYYEVLCCY
jgi:hypothetical protein